MNEEMFDRLISMPESELLDFKQGYDLETKRNEFVRDILAIANTPREGSGYIVLGVQWTAERGSRVVGLAKQFDDVQFQDALGSDRVSPRPRIAYFPLEFNSLKVGILEIPVSRDGPYCACKDYDGLQAGAIYFRRGTQNSRATGNEVRRVCAWFEHGSLVGADAWQGDSWRKFFEAVQRFDPRNTYLLGIDRVPPVELGGLQGLGEAPWRAVVDFDPDSEASGVLGSIANSLERHRVVHRIVKGSRTVHPSPGTHWFFARGLRGRDGTLSLDSHREWLKSYKLELSIQLQELARSISPSPVVAVVQWRDATLRNHLRTFLEELHGAFGQAVELVIVSNDSQSFEALAEECEAVFISMSLRSLSAGIAAHYSEARESENHHICLPCSSGASYGLSQQDWLWLSEDLELVHKGVGLVGEDHAADFRKGAEPTWRNFNLRHDCDRDATSNVRKQVEQDLQQRKTVRVNLYHSPGSGGTTLGRRIAWDIHTLHPTAILTRCAGRETAEKLGKIAALTENSVLVLVDGGQHSERDVDDLFDFLKANHIPVVLLQVLRRFKKQTTGNRQFWLEAQLSEGEADRFRDAYSQASPARRSELAALAKTTGSTRNAFFFGLTAFGRDFRGIGTHVEVRLEGLTAEQRRVAAFIAIAHYYGQQALPAQAFAALFGIPRSRTVELPSLLGGSASLALELLVDVGHGYWRMVHHLVALETMAQILGHDFSASTKDLWRQNLSTWGKEFATFCRGEDEVAGERMLELVRRVFVYRDNVEVLGTERSAQSQFAQLLEDVASDSGKIDLLRHLTECFPLEAHFQAHLGRLLSLKGSFVEGLAAIDSAIALQPEDHVLHHMRGMALRQRLRSESAEERSLSDMIATASDASESFEKARLISPDLEHGYISEVQMLVGLVDIAGKGRKDLFREVLARPETDPYLRGALERAEDLLDRLQHLYAGEEPSIYALDCRARLQRLYGDYTTALQAWDSLLTRPGGSKLAIRRQVVWTLLRRREESWEELLPKEVARIQELLARNLQEQVNDSSSLRLWLRAIRYVTSPPTMDSVIERIGYWKANTGALDAAFYLYVTQFLSGMAGSSLGAADAERALEECRSLARYRRDRTRSLEWVGSGEGIRALIHQSQLGEWKGDFWEFSSRLKRLEGRISSIDGPQKGLIELRGGMSAFFVPARSESHRGRDENRSVSFYLGFSYDGPRAWDVKKSEQ